MNEDFTESGDGPGTMTAEPPPEPAVESEPETAARAAETPEPSGKADPEEAPVGARHFSCVNCGASLVYRPGSLEIRCLYCGTVNQIPADRDDSDYLKENDYLAALAEEEKRQEAAGAVQAEAVKCVSCGAATTLSPDRTSENCPYCGSPLAVQNHYGVKLNVQALLPFQVDSDKAMSVYRAWVKSRWFAPNDFSRRATREQKLDGLYMPYWTYDSDTRTEYAGQRGVAYYTTQSYYSKGKRRTRRVRHIRWSSKSGTVDVAFDDVLVPASRSLPVKMCDKLEPWPLRDLQPFRQEYLAGFVTEAYQLNLGDGFADAKRRMEPVIDRAIRRDIGGDEQRIDSKDTRYNKVTFKHILLPVWLSAYRYGEKSYRFMINARTGEICGERPWSWIKIALASLFGAGLLTGLIYWLDKHGYIEAALDNLDIVLEVAIPLLEILLIALGSGD